MRDTLRISEAEIIKYFVQWGCASYCIRGRFNVPACRNFQRHISALRAAEYADLANTKFGKNILADLGVCSNILRGFWLGLRLVFFALGHLSNAIVMKLGLNFLSFEKEVVS